jgi:hypothetical protein
LQLPPAIDTYLVYPWHRAIPACIRVVRRHCMYTGHVSYSTRQLLGVRGAFCMNRTCTTRCTCSVVLTSVAFVPSGRLSPSCAAHASGLLWSQCTIQIEQSLPPAGHNPPVSRQKQGQWRGGTARSSRHILHVRKREAE